MLKTRELFFFFQKILRKSTEQWYELKKAANRTGLNLKRRKKNPACLQSQQLTFHFDLNINMKNWQLDQKYLSQTVDNNQKELLWNQFYLVWCLESVWSSIITIMEKSLF